MNSEKKNKELFITVRKLKMECYRKLNMFIEAAKEITELIKPADLDFHEWTLLNEVGGEFYKFESSGAARSAPSTLTRAIAVG